MTPLLIKRAEFDVATQKAGFKRCNGFCEAPWCGMKIELDRPEYHHRIEAALGGDNSLENMWVLHPRCHRLISSGRAKPLAKVKSIIQKRAGIKAKGPKLQSRNTFAPFESNTKFLEKP